VGVSVRVSKNARVYLPFLIAIPAYLIIDMVCLVIAVGWALAWITIQCCELAGQAIAQRRAMAPARASSSSLLAGCRTAAWRASAIPENTTCNTQSSVIYRYCD